MPRITVSSLLEYGGQLATAGAENDPGARGDRIRVRPLRSALFVPAARRDWIRKADRFGADALILDLEDAVQPAQRPEARQVIAEEIAQLSSKVGSVWVRVNAEPGELELDLAAAVRPGLAVIMLPKAFGPASVLALEKLLGYYEGRNGLAYGSVAVCPILETAGGIRNCYDIAMASARVEYIGGVVAPRGDTALALGMEVMSDAVGTESLYVRGKIVVDARSAGVRYPIGGTVTDLSPDHPRRAGPSLK